MSFQIFTFTHTDGCKLFPTVWSRSTKREISSSCTNLTYNEPLVYSNALLIFSAYTIDQSWNISKKRIISLICRPDTAVSSCEAERPRWPGLSTYVSLIRHLDVTKLFTTKRKVFRACWSTQSYIEFLEALWCVTPRVTVTAVNLILNYLLPQRRWSHTLH